MAYYNEIDPYCCKVLRRQIELGRLPKGFVDERDVREVRGEDLREFGQIHLFAGIGGFPYGFKLAGMPDDFSVLTAGFPCQDISNAGKRAGIGGERSGLWREGCRIISALRPRLAVLENVAALLGRGMGRVIGDLAQIGYDAEWNVISAADAGAPHLRERVWIVAYPAISNALRYGLNTSLMGEFRALHGSEQTWQDNHAEACGRSALGTLRNSSIQGLPDWAGGEVGQPRPLTEFERPDGREIERDFRGVAYGVRNRVDRLRGLGNSIVPQIAQWIGERIMEAN